MDDPDPLMERMRRGAGGLAAGLAGIWIVVALGRTSRIWGDSDGCVLAEPGWTVLQLLVAVAGAGLLLRVIAGRQLSRSATAAAVAGIALLAIAWFIFVVALPAANELDGCSS